MNNIEVIKLTLPFISSFDQCALLCALVQDTKHWCVQGNIVSLIESICLNLNQQLAKDDSLTVVAQELLEHVDTYHCDVEHHYPELFNSYEWQTLVTMLMTKVYLSTIGDELTGDSSSYF
jgi:hypothetical protein